MGTQQVDEFLAVEALVPDFAGVTQRTPYIDVKPGRRAQRVVVVAPQAAARPVS
jgi:hypothetical protein